MCKRHSFMITRSGRVFDGYGITDSHTLIREFAGLCPEDREDDLVKLNAYEWHPPANWPDSDWHAGLTKDTEVFEVKASHLNAMESHCRRLYPTMAEWRAPDIVRPLPEGLSIKGELNLSGTPIASLPSGLTVGGWLDLSHTPIASLPPGLTVEGGLYLDIGTFSTVDAARAALAKKETARAGRRAPDTPIFT